MTEEELQAIRTVMHEEIDAALSASEQRTDERLQALRLVMREEIGGALSASEQRTGEQLQALRLALREEIATTLSANEQRIGKRLDKIDVHLDKTDAHLDKIGVRLGLLEARIGRVGGRLDQLEASQRDVHEGMLQIKIEFHGDLAQIKTDQQEILLILNEATLSMNALQAEQQNLVNKLEDSFQSLRRDLQKMQADHRNLENKLDHHLPALRQNMQAFIASTQKFAQDFIEMNRLLNTRLTYHENSPLGDTHPRPPQPGPAA